ncbi:MAG: helix-turn-helix transcriptional regulator [bacterium]
MTFEQWQTGDFWKVYSNRIIQFRANNNLTQTQFSRKTGVSLSTIQAIENCKRPVGFHVVSRINLVLENNK